MCVCVKKQPIGLSLLVLFEAVVGVLDTFIVYILFFHSKTTSSYGEFVHFKLHKA